jgi:hypothetical protein
MELQKYIIKNFLELRNECARVQKRFEIQENSGGVVQPGENAGRSFRSSEIKNIDISYKNIPNERENLHKEEI